MGLRIDSKKLDISNLELFDVGLRRLEQELRKTGVVKGTCEACKKFVTMFQSRYKPRAAVYRHAKDGNGICIDISRDPSIAVAAHSHAAVDLAAPWRIALEILIEATLALSRPAIVFLSAGLNGCCDCWQMVHWGRVWCVSNKSLPSASRSSVGQTSGDTARTLEQDRV